ncbi:hypothetical protein ANCDUO_04033 [Ancylostoma duodenale]|uniref:Leucine Rich repeat-containing domain protein n=1 Tax=Ancylostoma duodenale TaxID=51022 RepID=A0A0C2H233_9BILA|nr:hypothetical protein ANCDUO_04033 [Ancylostoma duodenale]
MAIIFSLQRRQAIKGVPRLTHIDLGSNKITVLPPSLCQMTRLELPLSFSKLNALKWLDLKKNPLVPDLLKVTGNCGSEKECRQAAVNVVAYMKEMSREHNNLFYVCAREICETDRRTIRAMKAAVVIVLISKSIESSLPGTAYTFGIFFPIE